MGGFEAGVGREVEGGGERGQHGEIDVVNDVGKAGERCSVRGEGVWEDKVVE